MIETKLLRALNSATQYPSIPTYHELLLNGKGRLNGNVYAHFNGPVLMTEKIDGTNGRIVKSPDGDWLIGPRHKGFLTAKGDRVYNIAENIVDVLAPIADSLATPTDGYLVYYLEVFGGNIGAQAKQYTADKNSFSCRMFDIAHVPDDVVRWPLENIALWRDGGGQEWLDEDLLMLHSKTSGIPLTPRLGLTQGNQLPTTLLDTQAWLEQFSATTTVRVDETGQGASEGIVLRTLDRKTIAKARHADYKRTLGN